MLSPKDVPSSQKSLSMKYIMAIKVTCDRQAATEVYKIDFKNWVKTVGGMIVYQK